MNSNCICLGSFGSGTTRYNLTRFDFVCIKSIVEIHVVDTYTIIQRYLEFECLFYPSECWGFFRIMKIVWESECNTLNG